MKTIARSILAALALLPLAAMAATPEETARQALARIAEGAKVESVKSSPVAGLMEVIVAGEVMYLSEDGRHLLQGNLIDTVQPANLSEQTREGLRAARIQAFDRAGLISFEAGQPTHRVTVFTALDCGYCRRLHADIDAYLAQGISIDYVLIPLGGEGSAADATSASVFCAQDRRTALDKAMRAEAVDAAMCPSAYGAGKQLARALGIHLTPTLVAANGQKLRFVPAVELRSTLDALVAAR